MIESIEDANKMGVSKANVRKYFSSDSRVLPSGKKTPKKEDPSPRREKAPISFTSSTESSGQEEDIKTDFPGIDILESLELEDVISELTNALEAFEQRLSRQHDRIVEERRMAQSGSEFTRVYRRREAKE